jgi:ketosteroid isomerase-like protein
MTTRDTIEAYFDALARGLAWQVFLADEMTFTSHSTPFKRVRGKNAFLESTRGFYAMIESVEVRDLIVDGDRASAVARYGLRPPGGHAFPCDVAEVFTVEGEAISSFDIYFDSAPFS